MTPFLFFEYGVALAGIVLTLGTAAFALFFVFCLMIGGRKNRQD